MKTNHDSFFPIFDIVDDALLDSSSFPPPSSPVVHNDDPLPALATDILTEVFIVHIDDLPHIAIEPASLRHSHRVITTPQFKNYVVNACAYLMAHYLSYNSVTPSYAKCLATPINNVEPQHYSVATRDPRWILSIQ